MRLRRTLKSYMPRVKERVHTNCAMRIVACMKVWAGFLDESVGGVCGRGLCHLLYVHEGVGRLCGECRCGYGQGLCIHAVRSGCAGSVWVRTTLQQETLESRTGSVSIAVQT